MDLKSLGDGSAHVALIGLDNRYKSRMRMSRDGDPAIEIDGKEIVLPAAPVSK